MNTKDKIMQDAFELMLSKKCVDLSVNDIIKELKLTKGGFYYYFRSRDDLMNQIIENLMLESAKEVLRNVVSSVYCDLSVKERLESLFYIIPRAAFKCEEGNKRFYDIKNYLLVFYGLLDKYPLLADGYKKIYEQNASYIKEILDDGIERGVIKDRVNSEFYSHMFLAIRDGILTLNMIDSNVDIEEKLKVSFETVWNDMAVR